MKMTRRFRFAVAAPALIACLAVAVIARPASAKTPVPIETTCDSFTLAGNAIDRFGHFGGAGSVELLQETPGLELGLQGGYANTPAFSDARLSQTYEVFHVSPVVFPSPPHGRVITCTPDGLSLDFSLGLGQGHLSAPGFRRIVTVPGNATMPMPTTTIITTPAFDASSSGASGGVGLTYHFGSGFQLSASYLFLPGVLDVPGNAFAIGLGYNIPFNAATPFPTTTSRPPGVAYTPLATSTATAPAPLSTAPTPPPPPPTPSPTPSPLVTPPPPPAVPHAAPTCTTWQTSGFMEPVQGVWQDDPTFADRKQKQITQIDLPATYQAELPMVAGRDTALYGIDHYEAGGERKGAGHTTITIGGLSTCSTLVGVVATFHLIDASGRHDLGSSVGAQIPLAGPPLANNAQVSWSVSMPDFPANNKTFKIAPGKYDVWAELDTNGQPTGFGVYVQGKSVTTEFPPVVVAPVLLSLETKDNLGIVHDRRYLSIDAYRIADLLQLNAADYIPVKPGSVVATSQSTIDYSSSLKAWTSKGERSELAAKLTSRLSALAVLTKAGRVVVDLRDDDFDELDPPSYPDGPSGDQAVSIGMAINQKVILMRVKSPWDTALHEIIHTLPFLWSSDEMENECGRDYHNLADDGVANGVRMYKSGALVPRAILAGNTAILGKDLADFYIAQCTYAHLAQQLQLNNDPKTLFVRATAAQNGSGSFDPLYTVDGELDEPQPSGTWALVLRDAAGRQLQRAAFTPNWDISRLRAHRNLESVFFRFPMRAGVASVELRGPHGVAARETLSPAPPAVTVSAPKSVAAGARRVRIAWQSVTAGGREPLASVLYSTDGKIYALQSLEQPGSSFTVALDPSASKHWIKVIVSDGTRSGEREVVLRR
jgi:hypothetical protein